MLIANISCLSITCTEILHDDKKGGEQNRPPILYKIQTNEKVKMIVKSELGGS